LVRKNWKTPLNIDDGWKNKSFISLLKSGSFNIKLEKDSIRNSVANRRSALSDVEVKQKSLLISDNLYSLEVFKLSNSIALYSSIPNEVITESIFKEAIQTEKEVYFPRVNGSSLDFHRIHDLEQLKIGKFGVLEPQAHLFKADIKQIDLFVIPALAFDKSGSRLGYGKGYYDRALSNISQSKKVGLSYSFQVLDSVPIDKDDRKVGIIVTEQGIVFSRRKLGGK
jgi:5-formyltetrahydrofolate cyclo-ligase